MFGKWLPEDETMDTDRRQLVLGGAAAIAAVIVAALLVPAVYDRFIWTYLVGPVVADALNQASATFHGVTASPGYTLTSITVYALLLVYALFALGEAFDRFDIDIDEELVVSLTPFMVFGGLTRVVEDAALVPYPWNTAIISPVIYVVLAGIGVLLLLGSVYAEREGLVDSHHRALRLTGIGAAALLLLTLISLNAPVLRPRRLLLLLGGPAAAILAGLGVQEWAARLKPSTFLDSTIGRVAVAAHLLDGAATAVIVTFLGGTEKLPVPGLIMDTLHPAAFPAVKLGVVLALLGAIEKEEADRFTALAFAVLIAVGLGPGTRNLARALLGV